VGSSLTSVLTVRAVRAWRLWDERQAVEADSWKRAERLAEERVISGRIFACAR